MPATISVNFASQSEVENSPQPTNKSVSAKVLADVLGGGSLGGGYVTLASAQTITGSKTFNSPIILQDAPTLASHATRKDYVDAATYQQKYTYTIASARSTITATAPPEANGRSLSLPNALNLDVYRNGVLLVNNEDYTVAIAPTNTITFTTQLAAGAVVQVNQGGIGSALANAGVQQITAGTGISISPAGGTGTVTVGVNPSYDRFVPAGAIMAFGMNSAPSGWLICNGDIIGTTGTVQGVAASLLQTLRGLLGASHGTTGQLPDLRGIFVRGSGGPQTVGTRTYTGTFATKQEDLMREHTHNYTDCTPSSSQVGVAGASNLIWQASASCPKRTSDGVNDSLGGTENRPANISLLYCIKY